MGVYLQCSGQEDGQYRNSLPLGEIQPPNRRRWEDKDEKVREDVQNSPSSKEPVTALVGFTRQPLIGAFEDGDRSYDSVSYSGTRGGEYNDSRYIDGYLRSPTSMEETKIEQEDGGFDEKDENCMNRAAEHQVLF